MNTDRKTPPLKTVEKALDVLDCIVDSARPLNASEIAAKAGMSLSSTYKFLSTLVKKNYLYCNAEDKKYQVSLRVFRFPNNLSYTQQITQAAFPCMRELSEKTRETIHLAVPQGINAVFISKIDSPRSVGVQTRIGREIRLDLGATPQALMAYVPQSAFGQLCETVRLEPDGAAYAEKLMRLREKIRRDGYAFTVGQLNTGVAAVAAPVFGAAGDVVASMAIAAPQVRFSDDKLAEYLPLLKHACALASESLGHLE